jgi:hypothetical protein
MRATRPEESRAPGSCPDYSPSNNFGFPPLTEAERRRLREQQAQDTLECIMRDWGRDVLRRPPGDRPVLIAAKLEVLETLWEDPAAWVRRALELAQEEGGRRAD